MAPTHHNPRIAVAMSGGVDSSVAAALLLEQGYDVFGLTAQTWPRGSRCCSDEDIARARTVADQLGIPHYVVDLHAPFAKEVVGYFADEYARGRTPLPCAICNQRIKFGALLEKALALGASAMATGHYARLNEDSNGMVHLMTGTDTQKDQTYFLFQLSQHQLHHSLFPLGERVKADIQQVAAEHGLPTASRGESQDLCFVQPGEHHVLTEEIHPEVRRDGLIVDSSGTTLGHHGGIHRFTIGQRKGLGVATGAPAYVSALDPATNTVTIGTREDVMSHTLEAEDVNWLSGTPPPEPFKAQVRIRYNQAGMSALVTPRGQNAEVAFDEPQFAITPGQAAVFYVGDELLGGGWIRGTQREDT